MCANLANMLSAMASVLLVVAAGKSPWWLVLGPVGWGVTELGRWAERYERRQASTLVDGA